MPLRPEKGSYVRLVHKQCMRPSIRIDNARASSRGRVTETVRYRAIGAATEIEIEMQGWSMAMEL